MSKMIIRISIYYEDTTTLLYNFCTVLELDIFNLKSLLYNGEEIQPVLHSTFSGLVMMIDIEY